MRQIDEAFSIQRYILGTLSGPLADKPKFWHKRPTDSQARPFFRLDNPAGPKTILTPGWYEDQRVWVLTYFGTSHADAENRGDTWLRKLYNDPKYKLRIPMWMFNFPYYAPNLYVKAGVSTLAAGNYGVQIVAENDLGQLTKPSAVTSINLTTSNDKQITVQVPREPKPWPIGYRFHIYLSGSPVSPTAAHRIGSVLYTGNVDPTFTITSDVPNGTAQGNAPALMSALPAQSEVRFRYLKVNPDSVDTQMLEDPEEDGLFNYTVRFQTQAPGMRESPHPQAIASVDIEVDPEFA